MAKNQKDKVSNLDRAIQLNKLFKGSTNPEEDREKIIKILRDEIKLIKDVNQKIITEKDKVIEELRAKLEEKDQKILLLKDRFKKEAHYDLL